MTEFLIMAAALLMPFTAGVIIGSAAPTRRRRRSEPLQVARCARIVIDPASGRTIRCLLTSGHDGRCVTLTHLTREDTR